MTTRKIVWRMVARGYSTPDIADVLGVSLECATAHVAAVQPHVDETIIRETVAFQLRSNYNPKGVIYK